jgi:putative DNA primase/helicase
MTTKQTKILEYLEFIKKKGKPFSNKNREWNFPCPVCNDGKRNHFYFNMEKFEGYCQKCSTKFSAKSYAEILGYQQTSQSRGGGNRNEHPNWIYNDSTGNPTYGVKRYDFRDGKKSYNPCLYKNGQWVVISKNKPDYDYLSREFKSIPKILYNHDKLETADYVYIVEGEKCADRLQSILPEKHIATTNYGGAGKWHKSYSESLLGKTVYIIPDLDEKGKSHAEMIYKTLRIKIADIKTIYIKDLKHKEDVYDWVEKGNCYENLKSLIESTPYSEPERAHYPYNKNARNDIGRTEYFLSSYGENIRYTKEYGYLVYKNGVWHKDSDLDVKELVKQSSKNLITYLDRDSDFELWKEVHRMNSEKSIKAILNLANSDKRVLTDHSKFESHDYLINFKNGVFDSEKFAFREHDKNDFIMNQIPYNYNESAKCPKFLEFLQTSLGGDSELILYLQEIIGYSLTGLSIEPMIIFMYGNGKNGKSVLSELLQRISGGYSTKLRIESLMEKSLDGIPNDIARLVGKRIVVCSETKDGQKINESLIKDLTGNDTISARFLRKEFFDFRFKGKVFMYGNHKPVVKGNDFGIWRRLKLIPFNVQIEESKQDKFLLEKLSSEGQGIINWSLDGLKRLIGNQFRFSEPQTVKDSVMEYREESDIVGQFIKEEGYVCNQFKETYCKNFYKDYKEFCLTYGYHPLSQRRVSEYLKTNFGIKTEIGTGNLSKYVGIGKS